MVGPVLRAGVIALQGAYEPHVERFARLGLVARPVRRAREIEDLTHLVIPGGESTTLHHLMRLFGLDEVIERRYREGSLALLGTCAGAILLGRDGGQRPPRFGFLDAAFARNAFGRQVDSFQRALPLEGVPGPPFPCTFIRAPRVAEVGGGAEVLGRLEGEPILVRGPGLLAATFHPELSEDLRIHRLFLDLRGR